MKLIEYIPLFLQNVREYQLIFNVEDEEIENLKNQIENILQEVIVKTAKGYGLERYEKIYNIQSSTTDISTRRFTILSKINNRLPYSLNWLKNKLNNTIGESNYEIEVENKQYRIIIRIVANLEEFATTLKEELREQLSANLEITVILYETHICTSYFGTFVQSCDFIEINQRQVV